MKNYIICGYDDCCIPEWVYSRADKIIIKGRHYGKIELNGETWFIVHDWRGLAPAKVILTYKTNDDLGELSYLTRCGATIEYWNE